jgi:hypothetical protein
MTHTKQLFELLELGKSLVYDRLMEGTIVRKGTVPALNRVFKEAADVCMSPYKSTEPTTGSGADEFGDWNCSNSRYDC